MKYPPSISELFEDYSRVEITKSTMGDGKVGFGCGVTNYEPEIRAGYGYGKTLNDAIDQALEQHGVCGDRGPSSPYRVPCNKPQGHDKWHRCDDLRWTEDRWTDGGGDDVSRWPTWNRAERDALDEERAGMRIGEEVVLDGTHEVVLLEIMRSDYAGYGTARVEYEDERVEIVGLGRLRR